MTRTERIKEYILSTKPEICLERGRIYTEECLKNIAQPVVIRRARAFRRYLREMTLYIGPDDLLLGNTASKPRAAALFPEYAVNWIRDELDTFAARPSQQFPISEEQKAEIRKMCDAWDGATHFDRVDYTLKDTIGEYLMEPGPDGKGHQHPSINQTMSIEHNQNGDGHIIPDYVSLLQTGLGAVTRHAQTRLSLLDEHDPEYLDQRAFLESVVLCMEGTKEYLERLAHLAIETAKSEPDAGRKAELTELSRICHKISTEKPDTFYEALQLVLTVHLLIQIESNGHSISMGRMDSFLYPFYRRDCADGTMDAKKAQQLYECFLLKCFEANKLRDWGTTEILGGNQLFQSITLGGQTEDGETAVNPLSYIFLRALGNTNMNIPTVVVSIGKTTPTAFIEASLEALVAHKGGMPAFFNDDIAVDMMIRAGVSLRDARNWASMGCSEVRVPGKHGTGVTPVYVNMLKILELALHGGCNPATGKVLCASSRSLKDCTSIDEVIALFEEQLDYYLPFIPKIESAIAESYFTLTPTPFLSAVMNYRIDMAKDISWGRGPNYNDTIVHAHGFPNVANALTALDRVVFQQKKYSMARVLEAMDANFEGEENEAVRKALLDCPKLGNDEDEVDAMCNRIFRIMPEKMKQYKPLRGGQFGCTAQTVVMNVIDGEVIGATPDGRLSGEAIADNLSPTPGTDHNGLTAVFNSVAKIDHALMDNGSILNVKFHPTSLNDAEKVAKVASAIRVYFMKGGFQVQFNVISREVLEDAQRHPEQYRSLVVKVAGFSAFYVELEKKWQDQLIARTEYAS
ncbi:glycyl radical protein [Anaeromassilibacillus senegalensis]|uniref:glycyl radical protein n=1 Tax=Anaeromassilibacillus senegalensis TaxID=1673717 RepID=UPI000682E8CA|nr:pyruvate formate lyase family protein [Anaeromassilibacillus senegalensis]